MDESDFLIRTEGSVWMFEPVTDSAKEFVANLSLEGWRWLGKAFGIDARVANQLVDDLESEGFVLEIS